MAYVIRRKESVEAEVRRIFAEQVERAAALLAHWQDDPGVNVHQARQAFKRVRALLRLIRPGAPYVYRIENLVFRGLGRDLAYARDTEAVVEAVGLLDARASAPLVRESLRVLRLGLERRATQALSCDLHDLRGRIALACDALTAAARRVPDMPLEHLRRKHLRHAVGAARERCAAAFERAATSRTTEDLHRWRTQVKYVFNQSRLMQQLMPEWAAVAGPALDSLGRQLGQHHDLAVLAQLLTTQADDLDIDVHLHLIRNAVRDAQRDLAESALAAAGRLFQADGPASPGNVIDFASRA